LPIRCPSLASNSHPKGGATGLARDTLADIDKTKPLSIADMKRIVRAARDAGLLAMDHATEFYRRDGFQNWRDSPYLSPHGSVDAFLGLENRSSCPCNFSSQTHGFLERINNFHRTILFWTAVDPDRPELPRLRSKFDRLLVG
jgi:hypothetical protein